PVPDGAPKRREAPTDAGPRPGQVDAISEFRQSRKNGKPETGSNFELAAVNLVLPGVRQPKDAAKREDGPLVGALAFLPFILRAPLRRSQIVPRTCFVKLGG